jgi:hypothetical protein
VILAPLVVALTCPFVPNAAVGFYQWAATRPAQVLQRTADQLHQIHAGLIRIYLGPRYDYQRAVLAANRVRMLPVKEIDRPEIRRLLDDPCLPTIVLSVYPARDYGAGLDDINLNRPWSAQDAEAESSQLRALTERLYALLGNQNKTVIIANSEADSRLLDIANYTGSLPLAISNITAWQQARYNAIKAARAAHPNAKLRVLNAFEISLVNMGIDKSGARYTKVAGRGTNALRAIVPNVPFDLLSYSVYESTNSPYQTLAINTPPSDITARLLRDLAILGRATKKPIMIGELGFSRPAFDKLPTGGVNQRLAAAFAAFEKVRPAYVVLWQAFDGPLPDGAPDGFGLLEPTSTSRQTIQSFLNRPATK